MLGTVAHIQPPALSKSLVIGLVYCSVLILLALLQWAVILIDPVLLRCNWLKACYNAVFLLLLVMMFPKQSKNLFYLPDKLQTKLRGEGGIKALLGMVRCGHPDVLAQVARGIANFAKCESRASSQGKCHLD